MFVESQRLSWWRDSHYIYLFCNKWSYGHKLICIPEFSTIIVELLCSCTLSFRDIYVTGYLAKLKFKNLIIIRYFVSGQKELTPGKLIIGDPPLRLRMFALIYTKFYFFARTYLVLGSTYKFNQAIQFFSQIRKCVAVFKNEINIFWYTLCTVFRQVVNFQFTSFSSKLMPVEGECRNTENKLDPWKQQINDLLYQSFQLSDSGSPRTNLLSFRVTLGLWFLTRFAIPCSARSVLSSSCTGYTTYKL